MRYHDLVFENKSTIRNFVISIESFFYHISRMLIKDLLLFRGSSIFEAGRSLTKRGMVIRVDHLSLSLCTL